ncbi:hypothetical protein ACFLT9_01210 [Acidobacteriota bacterium]
MWKLIKADISYNRSLFFTLYSIMVPLFILNSFVKGIESLVGQIMFFNIVLLGALAGNDEVKHKYIRMLAVLPVSLRAFAISRFPVWMGYWISLMALLVLSTLIGRWGDVPAQFPWQMIAFTGLMFIWVTCMDFFINLKFVFKGRVLGYSLRSLVIILAVFFSVLTLVSIVAIGDIEPVDEFYNTVIFTPLVSLAILAVSLGWIALAIFTFWKRRTFTE